MHIPVVVAGAGDAVAAAAAVAAGAVMTISENKLTQKSTLVSYSQLLLFVLCSGTKSRHSIERKREKKKKRGRGGS